MKRQSIFLGTALLLTAVLMAGRLDGAAAHHDSCATGRDGTYCTWSDPDQAPWTPHWFNADVKLHSWSYATVADGDGGAVTEKCVHVMRARDGYLEPVACGPGIKDGFIPKSMRPGYLYTRQGSSKPAPIVGSGLFH